MEKFIQKIPWVHHQLFHCICTSYKKYGKFVKIPKVSIRLSSFSGCNSGGGWCLYVFRANGGGGGGGSSSQPPSRIDIIYSERVFARPLLASSIVDTVPLPPLHYRMYSYLGRPGTARSPLPASDGDDGTRRGFSRLARYVPNTHFYIHQ